MAVPAGFQEFLAAISSGGNVQVAIDGLMVNVGNAARNAGVSDVQIDQASNAFKNAFTDATSKNLTVDDAFDYALGIFQSRIKFVEISDIGSQQQILEAISSGQNLDQVIVAADHSTGSDNQNDAGGVPGTKFLQTLVQELAEGKSTDDAARTAGEVSSIVSRVDDQEQVFLTSDKAGQLIAALNSGENLDEVLNELTDGSDLQDFERSFSQNLASGVDPAKATSEAKTALATAVQLEAEAPVSIATALASGQSVDEAIKEAGGGANAANFEQALTRSLQAGIAPDSATDSAKDTAVETELADAAASNNLVAALATGQSVDKAISAAGGGDDGQDFEQSLAQNLAAGVDPVAAAAVAQETATQSSQAEESASNNLVAALASGESVEQAIGEAGGDTGTENFEKSLAQNLEAGVDPIQAAAVAVETASNTDEVQAVAAENPAVALASGQNVEPETQLPAENVVQDTDIAEVSVPEPVVQIAEVSVTTEVQADQTEEPVVEDTAQEAVTEEPVEQVADAAETPEEQADQTEEPAVEETAQEAVTEEPVEQVAEAAETPEEQADQTEEPVVEDTAQEAVTEEPVEQVAEAAETPDERAEQTEEPVVEDTAQDAVTEEPVEQVAEAAETPEEQVDQAEEPVVEDTAQEAVTEEPVEQVAEAAETPEEQVDQTEEPVVEETAQDTATEEPVAEETVVQLADASDAIQGQTDQTGETDSRELVEQESVGTGVSDNEDGQGSAEQQNIEASDTLEDQKNQSAGSSPGVAAQSGTQQSGSGSSSSSENTSTPVVSSSVSTSSAFVNPFAYNPFSPPTIGSSNNGGLGTPTSSQQSSSTQTSSSSTPVVAASPAPSARTTSSAPVVIANIAPDTAAVTASGDEDVKHIIVALSGSDVDGSVGSFKIISVSGDGVLYLDIGLTSIIAAGDTIVASGNSARLYFVPNADFDGSARFSYAAIDSQGLQDTGVATATIAVAAINDAPVNTVPVSLTVTEDIPTAISGLALVDVDAGTQSVTVTLEVTNGMLAVSGGTANITDSGTSSVTLTGSVSQIQATLDANVIFTPASNYTGSAVFTMTSDDGGNSGTGGVLQDIDTVGISITVVNDLPETISATGAGVEDATSITVALSGSDVDGTVASFRIVSIPDNGKLYSDSGLTSSISANDLVAASGNGANVYFVPDLNFNGTPSFTYRAIDNTGSEDASPAIASFTVTAVNDAPVVEAGGKVVFVENDAATVVDAGLELSDIDSSELTGATVSVTGNFVSGQDVLNFTAQNGISGSFDGNSGTLTLSGVASVANYQSALRSVTYLNGSEDPQIGPRTILFEIDDGSILNGKSISSEIITLVDFDGIVSAGGYGNYANGVVFGGMQWSVAGQFPQIIDGAYSAGNWSVDGSASLSTAYGNAPVMSITNEGGDQFRVQSLAIESIDGSQEITVTGISSDGSTVYNQSFAFLKNVPQTITPSQENIVEFRISAGSGSAGKFVVDNFTYATGNPVTSTVTISAVNDLPETGATAGSGLEDAAFITVTLSGTDVDGNIASFRIVNIPGNGKLYSDSSLTNQISSSTDLVTATGNSAEVYFVPNANYSGTPSFTYSSIDDLGAEDQSPTSVTITVSPVSDAPTLTVTSASGDEDTAILLTISAALTDADETITSYTISDIPAGATLSNTAGENLAIVNGSITLTPTQLGGLAITPLLNFDGSFDLSVTATSQDGSASVATSGSETLSVTVVPVSDAPTLTVTAASGDEDTAILLTISATLTDADETITSYTISDIPTGATLLNTAGDNLAVVNGSITLTPTQLTGLAITPLLNFDGNFDLAVTATSQDGSASIATSGSETLSVTVVPVNDAAETSDVTVTGLEDAPSILIALSGSDVDGTVVEFKLISLPGDGTLYSDTGLQSPISLNGIVAAVGNTVNVYFVPDANFSGTPTFTFAGIDDDGLEDASPATATINVTAVSDTPALTVTAASGDEDTAIPLSITAALVDSSETLTAITISGIPVGSVLSDSGGNSFTPTVVTSANLLASGDLGGSTYVGNGTHSQRAGGIYEFDLTTPVAGWAVVDGGTIIAGANYLENRNNNPHIYVNDGGNLTSTQNISVVAGNDYLLEFGIGDTQVPTLGAITDTSGGVALVEILAGTTVIASKTYTPVDYIYTPSSVWPGAWETVSLSTGAVDGQYAGQTLSVRVNVSGGTLFVDDFDLTANYTQSVNVKDWDTGSLKITPPENYDGSFDLSVTATSQDGSASVATSVSETLSVTV
ncbi:MAG: tandem-95 repeat protein, partial [Cohaesibacteraceae bacterium]|nr:tandem-95 repeat protein [Cohaesibacteraceae bacterium]